MKNGGRRNVREHREINNVENYTVLDIPLKISSLENMKITSSDPKDYLGRPGKGLITSLVLKTNARSMKKIQGMTLVIPV